MSWFTHIEIDNLKEKISLDDNIIMIGSCFANEVGQHLINKGFNACVNPFGTMYNPVSVIETLTRVANNKNIENKDILNISLHSTTAKEDNNTINKFCSFYHHSSLAGETPQEYITKANNITLQAHKAFIKAKYVIVTLGTAWVYRHTAKNIIVSNCHKINPKEFTRERLSVDEIHSILKLFISNFPDKIFILTVSPIRHLKESAHGNQISKSALILAIDKLRSELSNTYYFPSYEIMLDELRDYRFYAEDMVHPNKQAVDYIFNKFKNSCINPDSYIEMSINDKKTKQHLHISNRSAES